MFGVKSGGRMGQVMGEDAVQVAPAATACTHQCALRTRPRAPRSCSGSPFPVPAASRITPAFPPA